MRDIYLPASNSWVYEEEGKLLGFISWYQGLSRRSLSAPLISHTDWGASCSIISKRDMSGCI